MRQVRRPLAFLSARRRDTRAAIDYANDQYAADIDSLVRLRIRQAAIQSEKDKRR